ERNQFGTERYAFLFKPGQYQLDVQLGFLTHAIGLGKSPDDVSVTGAVRATAGWGNGDATCNFWRTVENLSVTPTLDQKTNAWSLSQGAALRRTHIRGNLRLSDSGHSSGGYMADCKIDGSVNSGSQQQWFSRNCDWGHWSGGVWNMFFLGIINPPAGKWPDQPYTVIEKTPVIREKPYLCINASGNYFVMVPNLAAEGTQGVSWTKVTAGTELPIEQFYIAQPEKDNAASLNQALRQGKNLLLTPGIYHLDATIRISRPDTVVLGLGYPTLIPDKGEPALVISDVDGVKVGGIMFDAGTEKTPVLLQVGEPGSKASHAKDPICLYDVFCRVGGAEIGTADCMVTIHSNDVIGDHFWLWRADHARIRKTGTGWTVNPNKNGLIVNGNNVTVYGLFVEHCQEYQTLWNGNGGRVFFYQSEMPYDPPTIESWQNGSETGYASYKVNDAVTTHEAWGLGIYCVFKAAPVVAENAIETPDVPGVKLHHMVTIRLTGMPGSGIRNIINGKGGSVITTFKQTME
ncbi:MAG: hypothetical protein WCH43_09200, partial [Verrucomicrobiota bacterium]